MKRELGFLGIVTAILFLVVAIVQFGCSEEKPEPKPEPSCSPQPYADTGGDVYFDSLPETPKSAIVGRKLKDSVCVWSPEIGLADAHSCETVVTAPEKTITYTLTVTNACGSATSDMRAVWLKEGVKPTSFKVKSLDYSGVEREYFTGYVPRHSSHYRTQYQTFPVWRGEPIPREYDIEKQCGPLAVGEQQCGDCWLWGTQGAIEDHILCADKKSVSMSRQEGIDCSGGGSCGGGDLIFSHYVRVGVPHTEDYGPYLGHNSRCNTKFSAFKEKVAAQGDVRFNTVGELQRAILEKKTLGVCGASRALSNSGGWQENAINAGTDHCYNVVGWAHGEDYGHKAGIYFRYKNSWGRGFGKNGFVYVYAGKDESDTFRGSVVTEAKYVDYEPACLPQPHADGGPDRTVKQIPKTSQSVRLGTPALPGTVYSWLPATGLDNPNVAMPLLTFVPGMKTTKYTVTARTQCGESHADVWAHYFHETRFGQLVEVTQ